MNPTEEQLKNRERFAQTPEQRAQAESAAKQLGVTLPLTSDAFVQQDEIKFETDTSTPSPSASSIQLPTFELTEEQKRQQKIVEDTMTEQEKLKSEEIFRAEQRAKFVDPEQEKVFKDLTSQLKGLQAEELAIPIQLQQENVGLGRTRAASAVIQADRLRENAIKALTVSATLEATRGNLAFALDQVDKAVAAKFDPIKKTIEVNLANLDLISKSPLATNAEKKEAARVAEEERKRQVAITKEADNETAKQTSVLEYAGIADALTYREMQKAKTAAEVKQIAKQKGLKTLAEQKVGAELAQTKAQTAKSQAESAGGGVDIKSGGLVYSRQDASEDSLALEQSRGQDGYVDPAIYQKLYTAWVGAGGILKDFLSKFPPKNYVNPANETLPTFLRPPKTSTTDFDNL